MEHFAGLVSGVCDSLKDKLDAAMKCQSLVSVIVLPHCKRILRAPRLFSGSQ